MNLIAFKHVEDCFSDSAVYRCEFDAPWTALEIARLSALGELEYFSRFPRPFFRLRGADGLVLKGVLGEATCRITLLLERLKEVEERLNRHFSGSVTKLQDA